MAFRKWLSRQSWLLRGALGVVALATAWLAREAASINGLAAPFIQTRAEALPNVKVGLVLGCSQRVQDGRSNLFFQSRIDAAAALFRAGKIQYLLLSGDNSRKGYDEPSDMRRALEAAGVPRSRIVLDYAGFRTLDSVVRAREVFGVRRLIIVSQHFHNVRAVYLARAHGMQAYGFDAVDVGGAEGFWVKAREVASRVFAVLDVEVLHTTPRFTGPKEATPF